MKRVLLILIFALLIRILPIGQTFYEDEILLNHITQAAHPHFIETKGGEHPPLGFILFKLTHLMFGGSSIASRLIPLVFGLLTILLTYHFAKRNWNKKTAFFAAMLMAFSFHGIFLSLVISIDPILMFLTVLTMYLLFEHTEHSNGNDRSLMIGIVLGLGLLTKYSFLVQFPIIFAVLLARSSLPKAIADFIKMTAVSVSLFLVFPIYSYFTDWNIFMNTVHWLFTYTDASQNLPFGTSLIILYVWSTPLLVALTLWYFAKIQDKEKYHLGMWIFLTLIFYTFLVKRGDYSRYLGVILPAICICGGNALSRIKWSKKKIVSTSILVFVFTVLFHLVNFMTISSVQRPSQDPMNYINLVTNFKLNFFFPYVVDHGSWFGTDFLNVVIVSVVFLIFVLSLLFENGRFFMISFLFLISSGIAYNIFLNNEFIFHLSQPNPDWAVKESIAYVKANNLSTPIYTTNKAILYYFNEVFGEKTAALDNRSIRIDNLTLFEEKIKKYGGTVIFVDFSTLYPKEKIMSHPNCNVIKTFYSKNYPISYISTCQPDQQKD